MCPHPAVPSSDVLQGTRGRLGRVLVELAALQQPVVDAHDLWVPEPLHALGVLGDLCEGDDVRVQVVLQGWGWGAVLDLKGCPLRSAPCPWHPPVCMGTSRT